jgi:hypothetical protein
VPEYHTFDARLAFEVKQLEFSIVGQEHVEFGALRIPRSFYGKVTWRFDK